MDRVLLIDDDVELCGLVQQYLQEEGFGVEAASDGVAGLERALAGQYAIVIIDVMLPDLLGFEVLRRLRAQSHVPVLMLTARGDDLDRILGLELGADDYLPKPFALEELLARLRALLRRALDKEPADVLRFADLTFDLGSMDARREGRRFELTTTEAHLLELFMRNPRQVLPRSLIYERVWGYDFSHSSNALDVYVGYLRRKLEANGELRLIHTVRGTGYVLREQ